jgi:hypothetical protein
VTSTAVLNETGLHVRLDWRAAALGLSHREFHVPHTDIVSVRSLTARDARRLLRFRLAGTAVPGWWLMGWFSRSTRDGRRAWVWVTPKRELVAIESTQKNRSLVIVPRDWFAKAPGQIAQMGDGSAS